MIDFEALAAPFDPTLVSWRVGATTQDKSRGMALAYIDARDVMERLDETCGPEGWQCRYSHANGKTVCDIAVKVGDEWVWKADGAGDTDYEAEKGALSDAFKRAAVRWGIGRYLYGMSTPWVEVEPAGKSFKIKDGELRKLEALLEAHTGKIEWGSPSERAMARALANSIKTTVFTSDDVRRFREANAGVFAQLRKVPREHMDRLLSQIDEQHQAKVAA